MKRRSFLKMAAGVLAAPQLVHAESERVLRFIPQSDLTALDPVWTSVYVTRNHGYLVFDTLYGQDSSFRVQPQMVEGAVTEPDGLIWRLTLRDGLLFHDDTPVLARDCVASIRRWAKRDAFGQTLMLATDELSAADDRTIVFRLKTPFPLLPDALGKMGINMLPIMPERLANTDPFKQVTEMVGSGPFRFLTDERLVGARVAYQRFDKYRPREQGTPDWTAGPKIAHFDKVVWNVIPDGATASAAMQKGEADWWEQPVFDLLPLMARSPDLTTSLVEVTGNIGLLRMNQLFPPFDNAAIRRALLGALDQAEFMAAVVGDDAKAWRGNVGVFAPDTPMASAAGLSALTGPRDASRARREIEKAGYRGEPVVIMTPSDYPRIDALANVAADLMRRCGLNVDLQATDWGSVIRRRTSKAPVSEGGWSVFITTFTGVDMSNPASHLALRGNGADSWFGWPVAPELERLRDQWLKASGPAEQKSIAAKIQAQAFIDVPFLPLGQFFQPTVQRKNLQGGLKGMTLFWNIRRV
ncbi:peptide/nickel transport system substrate-binding protein [Rhizobiales bacterium GAS191]|nr:peptide/nickel transport system substrate-binding protein [Rhizobiales bacterium GAS113]SED98069.1 peptide/nickel transport system substrate-binding protein [Rhizobiales bacterium GAS191]